MLDEGVRLDAITIRNIKNVTYGKIKTDTILNPEDKDDRAGVVGIYGQNGSGKTAVIDVLFLLRKLMKGEPLQKEWIHFIREDAKYAVIKAEFMIGTKKKKKKVSYEVILKRSQNGKNIILEKEILSYGDVFFSKEKRNKSNSSIFTKQSSDFQEESYLYIKKVLMKYACVNFFVVRNVHIGEINGEYFLPVLFKETCTEYDIQGNFNIKLRGYTSVYKKQVKLLESILKQINIVMRALIPGFTIEINHVGREMDKEGTVLEKIELLSCRNTIRFPVRYESEGIVNLISVMSILIQAYNHPYLLLAVDELDAGIYEYLLGEILEIFERGGKGQLIFTSHNLRPLEMLHWNCIVFTTSNPESRFIRMDKKEEESNLRDAYLRCITLGGKKENMYEVTDSFQIARAFRNAGRVMNDGTE